MRGRLFGLFLGSTVTGAGGYYYLLDEYRVANELLTEDIYVCPPALSLCCREGGEGRACWKSMLVVVLEMCARGARGGAGWVGLDVLLTGVLIGAPGCGAARARLRRDVGGEAGGGGEGEEVGGGMWYRGMLLRGLAGTGYRAKSGGRGYDGEGNSECFERCMGMLDWDCT